LDGVVIRRSTDATVPRPALPDLSGLIVLVVDDTEDHLDMISTYLRACGADVLEARNGLAALAYAQTTPKIDAIVTDLFMPSMDGVELLQRLRRLPGRQSTPVIAVTAFYENMDTHVARFNAFLRKPINFDQLCSTIRDVTRR
jgi:two-component system, chemotaxis family, CheB/CheR fusion protein